MAENDISERNKYFTINDELKSHVAPIDTNSHALYIYNANRPTNNDGSSVNADATVADFLHKESVSDGNFSLSVVTLNIEPQYEKELRLLIASRLGRGTLYGGNGNISKLALSSEKSVLCYYCLLRNNSNNDAEKQQKKGEENIESITTNTYCSNEFVFCFLTEEDVALDLFRSDLDHYCQDLVMVLNSDPLLLFEPDEEQQVIEMEKIIKPSLNTWWQNVAHSLCRVITFLKEDVKYLIYAALLDIRVHIVGQNDSLKKDILRFVASCSLSELLNQLKTESIPNAGTPGSGTGSTSSNSSQTNSLIDTDAPLIYDLSLTQVLTLTLTEQSYSFDTQEYAEFCELWAESFQNGDTNNPVFLRQVIENFKLKAIQDMNTLKRLVRQAETDHYALYRSYVFLKASGNGPILLKHAYLEHRSMTSRDAQDVLSVLKTYIDEEINTHKTP